MTKRLHMHRVGMGLSVVLLCAVACREKVPEPESRIRPPPAETASVPAAEPGASAPAKGLVIEEIKVGTGPAAKAGDEVSVHYTGTLLNGEKFDSSLDRDTPFDFKLGAGMVIKGWDQGVAGMKKGGKRKLTIPPELGYGKRGSPPTIPPDATLVFEVELINVK